MSDRFDTEYLEVGDTFVGGPIEQSYFIGAVMAAGGEVDIHGDTVYIVQLPKKNSSNQSSGSIEAKAPVSEKTSEPVEEPKAEETVEKTSEPVEESKVEAAPEPKSEEPKVEAASEPKPAAKPGPKPKTSENKAGE